jgi:hypothetical protein
LSAAAAVYAAAAAAAADGLDGKPANTQDDFYVYVFGSNCCCTRPTDRRAQRFENKKNKNSVDFFFLNENDFKYSFCIDFPYDLRRALLYTIN